MEISPLLDGKQLFELMALLRDAQRVVITAHRGPDGDAMGSTLAWADYLRSLGKQVRVILPTPCPDFLRWLPGARNVLYFSNDDMRPMATKFIQEADLICLLDFNALHRLQDMAQVVERSKAKRLMIDHHEGPDEKAADFIISHPKASSTCELVFKLIFQLGAFDELSRNAAACIYCGMMTDTGGFTYNSSRPEIFYIIGQLLAKNIDKDEIYNRVFHNYSTNALRLRAHIILNKMKVIEELHASYYTVTKEEMAQFHFIKGDMEGLVNIPQQIKGLKLSISLREDTERPKTVLVSLRSCNGFHCQPMAAKFFNGGGHADASGGRLNCTIEEAEQIAIKAILYYKEELQ